MELVRWEQVEDQDGIRSGINELFEDALVVHGRNKMLLLKFGILPWTFLKVRIRISFRAELPGMREADLETEVNEGILTLSGQRFFEEPAM